MLKRTLKKELEEKNRKLIELTTDNNILRQLLADKEERLQCELKETTKWKERANYWKMKAEEQA